jgi:hypothetical protein
MSAEIDVAIEFLCLSFVVWGARGTQHNQVAAAFAWQDNQ